MLQQYLISIDASLRSRNSTVHVSVKAKTTECLVARDSIEVSCDACLLYTSDAADDMQCVDLGGRRIIKKRLTLGAPLTPPRARREQTQRRHGFFQAEDGIRDVERSRGLGDVYKRQGTYKSRQ